MEQDSLRLSIAQNGGTVDENDQEIQNMQKAIITEVSDISSVSKSIITLEGKSNTLREQNAILETNIQNMKTRLETKRSEIEHLNDTLKRCRRELSQAEDRYESLQNNSLTIDKMSKQERKNEMQRRVTNLITKKNELKSYISDLELSSHHLNLTSSDLESGKQRIRQIDSAISDKKQEIADQEDTVREHLSSREQLNHSVKKFSHSYQKKSRMISSIQAQIQQFPVTPADVARVEDSLRTIEQKMAKLGEKRATLDVDLKHHKEQRSSVKKRNEKTREMNKRLENLRKELAADNFTLKMLQQRPFQYKMSADVSEMKDKIPKLDAKIRQLKIDRERLRSEALSLKAATRNLELDMADAERQFRRQEINRDFFAGKIK